MTALGGGSSRLVQRFDDGLYVREVEPRGDAGTLVYIHGLGESGYGFEGLMAEPRLGAWRHLAADLPGYGKSPWRAEPLGLDEHAALLAGWLSARAAEPVVLLGHSMGGVVGTLLGERLAAQGRIRGFINVEGNLSYEDCGFSGRVAGHSQATFLDGEHRRLLDQLYEDGQQDRALRVYYPSLALCDPLAYYRNSVELVQLSRAEGLASRMRDVAVPKVYLLGSPRGTGEHSRGLLDHAGIAWHAIENAGHWPFLDQHDAFVDRLLPFLERLGG